MEVVEVVGVGGGGGVPCKHFVSIKLPILMTFPDNVHSNKTQIIFGNQFINQYQLLCCRGCLQFPPGRWTDNNDNLFLIG